jgi:probable HAF family extracellular repeat protein
VNKSLLRWIAVMTFAAAPAIPSLLLAQQPRYRLIDLGTLGGPQSYVNDGNSGTTSVTILNNKGKLVGWADTSAQDPFSPAFCFTEDCFVSHGFQWQDGVRTDLGALDSQLGSQAVWISSNGLIAGTSENGQVDPLLSGFPEFRAVLWRNGGILDLGTLPEGGFESSANAVNSKGQVIGWATNTAPDPNSMAAPGFLPTQTRAFVWQNGTMKDLGTLGTGSDAIAEFMNELGQVVGWSYTGETASCVLPGGTPIPVATHSFIWDENHGMRDLGTLGGGGCAIATALNESGVVVGNNLDDQLLERGFLWNDGAIQDLGGTLGGQQAGAENINNLGEVAGFATLAGEATFHATLWKTVGEITDLGVIGQDSCSFATSINSKTQVVGASAADCFASDLETQARAILWEDGSLFDLNTLLPPGASLNLHVAQQINDRGEIAGTAVDVLGNQHAFLLVPCAANEGANCQEVVPGASDASPAGSAPLARRSQVPHASSSILQTFRPRLGPVPYILTNTKAGNKTEKIAAARAVTSLVITSGPPPNGTVGRLYDFRCLQIPPCNVIRAGFPITAAGGLPPYSATWTAQPGSSLPPGLFFPFSHECLGVSLPAICGEPSTAGSYEVVITVTDSESPPHHANASYTIHIFP